MNNQYLQWISGPKRGEVESVEMMQDGQTFEDVVILSNGRKIPMSKVGKEFIVLPSANAALPQFDLDMMYPNEQKRSPKQSAPKNHSDILGLDIVQSEKPAKQIKKQSSFASDLFSRSKKTETKIDFNVSVDMPSSSFFKMLNETFDDATINEVIDIIVDSIDQNELKNSIRKAITNFYGETHG